MDAPRTRRISSGAFLVTLDRWIDATRPSGSGQPLQAPAGGLRPPAEFGAATGYPIHPQDGQDVDTPMRRRADPQTWLRKRAG